MCRSRVYAAAFGVPPVKSSPTDIRPGSSSRILRNRPMSSRKSGWSMSYRCSCLDQGELPLGRTGFERSSGSLK
jgi:hypothetical protein